ncbi:MAG: SpoIIE family protein phosphatase [Lachnospiraceae bacterium]|nr:SpoIIE family protein phosphatase [Lachnospiraceae bacterium]
MGRVVDREPEIHFWLQYEKKKMQECAGTLHNLAEAFLIEEKDEEFESDKERQNLFLKRRLKENRGLMADHLKEMAAIMEKSASENLKITRLSEKKEKQMGKLLFQEGLVLEDFFTIEKENGRKEVVARLYQNKQQGKNNYYSTEEVAAFLSVILNTRLMPTIKTPFFITEKADNFRFEEDSKYMVLTGFARTVKEGERVSGDNYSFFETDNKNFFALLSDGMGSGEKAGADSEVVLSLAERFLEGGFSAGLTVKMINDMIMAGGEGKNMSTLDICSVDLYTGETEFLKVGAAYSLLKRDGHVEKIPSLSLPLGIFYDMETNYYKKQLLDGDYVFLFSDGILDSFVGDEGEEFLKEIVAGIPFRRPSEMAGHIMKHAISASGGRVRDDMTVLVMGIWENLE